MKYMIVLAKCVTVAKEDEGRWTPVWEASVKG